MASMILSLPGLFKNAERALRSSRDDMACMSAYSLGEMIDNLRLLKNGECTVDEFFAVYVFGVTDEVSLAESVKKERYLCMREEPAEEEEPTNG